MASGGHLLDAGKWFEGAEKDAPRTSHGLAGNIQAIVIAIDEVNVGVAGWSENHGVSWRVACGGVGGWVINPQVGFNFNYAGSETRCVRPAYQDFSEKVARYTAWLADEEGAIQGVNESVSGLLGQRHAAF